HARSLTARTGRFNAVDPVFDGTFAPQRWNRYSYGLNNPIHYVDSAGMNADPCAGTNYNTGTCVTAPVTNPDWDTPPGSCWWPCDPLGGGGGGGGDAGRGGGGWNHGSGGGGGGNTTTDDNTDTTDSGDPPTPPPTAPPPTRPKPPILRWLCSSV